MTSSRSIRIAASARRDIAGILQFTLQTWDEEQFEEYAADLDAGISRLARFPDLGKEVGLKRPGLRSFRVRRHMILYRADSDTLTILRVVHARMDLSRVIADG